VMGTGQQLSTISRGMHFAANIQDRQGTGQGDCTC
jgi:hypothetical protein